MKISKLLVYALPCVLFATITAQSLASPTDYVDPMVGTATHGHTFPGATMPFGMVQLSPDTRVQTWDGTSGYHYDDPTIMGFSHTHLCGTGGGDLGDILVMPEVGPARFDLGTPGNGYISRFSHKSEVAHPGYYKVFLDDPRVTAELTATERTGFHRYTFPSTDQAHFVVDLDHGIQSTTDAGTITVENGATLSGSRKSSGWGGDRTVYFVMEFSRPFKSCSLQTDGQLLATGSTSASGRVLKAVVDYSATAGQPILIKVGISATGIDGARKNLRTENPGWDFDAVRARAGDAWNKALGVIDADSADPHLKRTFYTNLYLSMIDPSLFDDVDKAHYGFDHKVHASDFDDYTTFSIWDIYRAETPLLDLIQPRRMPDLIQSLLMQKQELGWHTTPIWPLWANETWCMIGYHSADIIADASLKGLAGPDKEGAYQAIRDTAMQDGGDLGNYEKYGYVPSQRGDQATSKTIEYSVDDWSVARMAEALGHKKDAAMFYRRSLSYYNLFDRHVAFERGRKTDGTWRTQFDAIGMVGDEYTEADPWQYAFGAQQDVPGMIRLYGGDAGFVDKLDGLFTADSTVHSDDPDISGLIGQYSQGDEQCHHVAYLYDYAGAPSKTQYWIRQVMRREYTDGVDGECGNVDCGQMAAWYIFSALGFYPVNPTSGVYAIGSPAVDKAVLHLDRKVYGGHTFTVIAASNSLRNVYIQSATWNGKPYDRCWLTFRQIAGGGVLRFTMGPKPNLKWASSTASRPPSTIPAGITYPTLPPPAIDKYFALKLPIRVTCGSDDPIGNYVPDPNIFVGSTNSTTDAVAVDGIASPAPEGVYQSERYGNDFTYSFVVPQGKYAVRLHFSETFDKDPGYRIENVAVNGRTVLPNFEIYKAAGGLDKACIKTFDDVDAVKGRVTVRVWSTPSSPDKNAKINGIEVLPE